MTDDEIAILKASLIAEGFNNWVADALAEREVSLERAMTMSTNELLEEVLEWNGIIGYTSSILDAVDNIHNVAG